jgi:hypothetical protein
MDTALFHMAFPVRDIEETRHFYETLLGCEVGRHAKRWIDFNFYGHQISAHLRPDALGTEQTNPVDGNDVPVRHFGAVLKWEDWEDLAQNLKNENVPFLIDPHIRFESMAGEQATFFVSDPSGNALEFKAFRNIKRLFDQ